MWYGISIFIVFLFHLKFNILICATGSVACVKLPELVALLLKNLDCEVRVALTERAQIFLKPEITPEQLKCKVLTDSDEWKVYEKRKDPVLHIELRKWADILVVAPLDANTLAKFAHGICDNLVSCIFRCWNPKKPVVLCPAMNTFMYESPLTADHLKSIQDIRDRSYMKWKESQGASISKDAGSSVDTLIVGPQTKYVLECGDEGSGALAKVEDIVQAVASVVQKLKQAR